MTSAPGRTTNVGGVITLLAGFLATALVAGLLGAGLLMPAVGAAGASARAGVHVFDSLPAELKVTPLAQQSRILGADGSIIATFYDENRIVVPLTKVAPVMQTAIVAIEDDRFYEHGGIDPHGILRALVNNSQGDGTAGRLDADPAVRQADPARERLADNDVKCAQAATNRSGTSGYARKLQELKYAVSIEKTMTKEQILQGYLNIAYFGVGHVRRRVGRAALLRRSTRASSTCSRRPCWPAWSRRPSTYDPLHEHDRGRGPPQHRAGPDADPQGHHPDAARRRRSRPRSCCTRASPATTARPRSTRTSATTSAAS